jgi:CrcB protein
MPSRLFAILRTQNPKIRSPLAVSLGAIAGALCRYYLTLGINQWSTSVFPYSTFVINLSGAFLMGFLTTLLLKQMELFPDLRLFLAVGFLGACTTFATYELDAEKLLHQGHWEVTVLYWICMAVLGVLCLELGSYLAQTLNAKRSND